MKIKLTHLLLAFSTSVCFKLTIAQQINFKVIRQWKYINYTWPSSETYEKAITSGSYMPENIMVAGVTYFENWLYLSMPRMKPGVPATLARIPVDHGKNSAPLLRPFPTWEFNKLNDCVSLQNVQNTEIDINGEIWIIDGGHANSLTPDPIRNCPPKLIIFDIKANETSLTHYFPEEVAGKNTNFLYDLVVGKEGDFAFITDNSRDDPGIIVFSRRDNQSWKIRHSPSMRADPSAQNFTVNGVSVTAPINIAGIAMGLESMIGEGDYDREIFYSPLSSLHLYSINASALQNKNNSLEFTGKVKDVGVKTSQTDGMMMSNKGILYYGLLGENSIARWDSRTPFATEQTLLTRDFQYIQWSNSFTIDLEENLIVLTNTLQKFIYKKLDTNLTNFWLISANIGEKSYLHSNSSSDWNEKSKRQNNVSNVNQDFVNSTNNNEINSSTKQGFILLYLYLYGIGYYLILL